MTEVQLNQLDYAQYHVRVPTNQSLITLVFEVIPLFLILCIIRQLQSKTLINNK